MTLSNEFTFRIAQHFSNDVIRYLRFNADSNITPTDFILKIINRYRRESLMNVYKLHITQYCEDETQVLPFIRECQGKLDIHENTPLSTLFNSIRQNLINNYYENEN